LEKKLVASAAAAVAEPGMVHRDEVIVAPVAPVAPVVARVEEDRKTMSEEELRRRYFPVPEDKDKDYDMKAYPITITEREEDEINKLSYDGSYLDVPSDEYAYAFGNESCEGFCD
jgi:hypothetical protein